MTHRSSESIEQRLKHSLSGGSKKASQINFKKQPSQSFNSGDLVIHSLWGQGIVQRIEGRGEDAILHLNFEGLEKKLIAKYAPLKKNVGTEVS